VEPGSHRQSIRAELPDGELEPGGHSKQVVEEPAAVLDEYLPLGQSTHLEDPFTALYLPPSHATHSTPSSDVSPAYPLLQVHWAANTLPAGEKESAGHAVHGSLPAEFLKVPAAHGSHTDP
jgi:hypothetical protein